MVRIMICPYCNNEMAKVGSINSYNGYWECFECGCCLDDEMCNQHDEIDWVADTYEKS